MSSKWTKVTENYVVWCHLGDLTFDNIRNTILLLDLIFLGLAQFLPHMYRGCYLLIKLLIDLGRFETVHICFLYLKGKTIYHLCAHIGMTYYICSGLVKKVCSVNAPWIIRSHSMAQVVFNLLRFNVKTYQYYI